MRAIIRKEVCRKVGLLQRQIDELLKAQYILLGKQQTRGGIVNVKV
jgi:hypothetical protein